MVNRTRMTRRQAFIAIASLAEWQAFNHDVIHLLDNRDGSYSLGHHPEFMECPVCETQGDCVGKVDIDIIPSYEIFAEWLREVV